MSFRYSALASGSSGNASFLDAGGFGILIDFGVTPRRLTKRLESHDLSWQDIHAALLTHTHGDHWNDNVLSQLIDLQIPLYCHRQHRLALERESQHFAALETAGLVREYDLEQQWSLGNATCQAFPVVHDDFTVGFRFEGQPNILGIPWAMAHASDLGTWSDELVPLLSNVDLLALEFNHDVDMEQNSGRIPWLVGRVLGDGGHLSNDQAATLLARTLSASEPGRLRHLVSLHLSSQCNSPALAQRAGERVREEFGRDFEIHIAHADRSTPLLGWNRHRKMPAGRKRTLQTTPAFTQPLFPGWDDESAT